MSEATVWKYDFYLAIGSVVVVVVGCTRMGVWVRMGDVSVSVSVGVRGICARWRGYSSSSSRRSRWWWRT